MLKGQCHEIFVSDVFHESSSHKLLKITLGSFQIFFKNLQRYSQVKGHHRYQRHRGQIFPPVSLVLLIPVATIPVTNLASLSTTSVASCHRFKWHRWQKMETISDCWQFKVNWKEKIYLYASSTTQTFLIEDFFHLPPVSFVDISGAHWAANISANLQKNRNGPTGKIRGLGKTAPFRKPEVANLVALSLFLKCQKTKMRDKKLSRSSCPLIEIFSKPPATDS
jgi:hypothetical protein